MESNDQDEAKVATSNVVGHTPVDFPDGKPPTLPGINFGFVSLEALKNFYETKTK